MSEAMPEDGPCDKPYASLKSQDMPSASGRLGSATRRPAARMRRRPQDGQSGAYSRPLSFMDGYMIDSGHHKRPPGNEQGSRLWTGGVAPKRRNPGGMLGRGDRGLQQNCTGRLHMTPTETVIIERRISPERLALYRAVVGGDLERAVELYLWNAEAGAAFWTLLGHLEVLVRNSMHQQLTNWSVRVSGDTAWCRGLRHLFNWQTAQDIATARRRATAGGRPETAGRIVAELPMGFWRFLLASRYERTLWRTCLYKAFPGQGRRSAVPDKLSGRHQLRNRIAHHEPVHNRPLVALHADALQLAVWVCPTTGTWITAQSAVVAVLTRKPGNRVGVP